MTLSSSLSTVIIFYVILNVYCKEIDQRFIGSQSLREEANFYKLLEVIQRDNEHARSLLNVKRSLESEGKSIPSLVYKRMKMKVLKSLRDNYLRRRKLYDEQSQVFDSVNCQLRIIPVEVPHPPTGFTHPDFIDLHRCVGGCSYRSPSIIHCAVEATSTVPVYTLQFDLNSGEVLKKTETMVNHTKCGCQCIVQEHHCDNLTETYNNESCTCDCESLPHLCDNITEAWDIEKCGCSCIKSPETCTNKRKIWNLDTCKCECLENITKRCKRKKKLLNEDTCECYCDPKITCPPGAELHSYDCSCESQA